MITPITPSVTLSPDTAKAQPATGSFSASSAQSASPVAYFSPTIQVDMETHIAIVEFVDTKTGQITSQYPSEQQMNTYREQALTGERAAHAQASPPPTDQSAAVDQSVVAPVTAAAGGPAQAPPSAAPAATPQSPSTAAGAASTTEVIA